MTEPPLTYRDSGVDLEAAQEHTARIANLVSGGVTGFAGAIPLPPLRDGLLVGATDGVGTKLLLAIAHARLDGLGQDLVAMCVNDLICVGARPLTFLDYLAVDRLDPVTAGTIVASIARACDTAGCALVGGETAELPDLYPRGHFDLAGFATGVVERDRVLGPQRVRDGDPIVGIASSGLHSNGFSLVRRLIAEGALADDADLLLTPTRIYVDDLLACLDAGLKVRSAAHITGGGLPENLPRALPEGWGAELERARWSPGDAVSAVLESGRVTPEEAERTFNMGLGMCLVVSADDADAVCARIEGAGVVGRVSSAFSGVRSV